MTKHTQGTSVPANTTSHDQEEFSTTREKADAAARASMLRSMGPATDKQASNTNQPAAPQNIAPGTSVPTISPLTTLENLDRYMAAINFDESHPWRKEIAATLASVVPATEITGDCIDNIDCAVETIDALLRLALESCSEEKGACAIRAARRYVGDISDYSNCLGWSAA